MTGDIKKPRDVEGARNRAQTFFAKAEERDATVKQLIAQERAATDAKTAKLKALRLAREEADRASAPAPQPVRKAPRRVKH
ncbi:MAG: hypothetical protein ACREHE_07610 [Rhizomicrobium sp.]